MDQQNKNDDDIRPLSPEEIKAIGEIEIGPSKHEQFLNAHYKKLMWGGIGVSLLAGGIIAWFSYRNDHRHEAAAQVVQAFTLKKPGAAAAAGAYDAAALQKLQSEYAGTPSADTASLLEGLNLLASDKPENGEARLREVAAISDNTLVAARAQVALAGYYMSNSKDKEATEAWQALVAMPANPYTALGYLTLGDMAATSGNKDAARGFYKQAQELCATSSLVTGKTVEIRLLLLDVDAPKPVVPVTAPADDKKANPLDPFGDSAVPTQPADAPAADPFDMTAPLQPAGDPLGTPAL